MKNYIAVLFLFLMSIFPGNIRAGESENTRPLLVTVDDLPVAGGSLHRDPDERREITLGLLDALDRPGVRAVGFVIWGNVRSEEDRALLELWLERGHELGNHSFSHLDYSQTEPEDFINDVEKGRAGLHAFLDEKHHTTDVRFFRFPYLREGDTEEKLQAMRAYLEQSGQRNLPVTIDNQDHAYERRWVEAFRSADETAMTRTVSAYHEALHLATRHHEGTGDRLFSRTVPQVLLLHANAVGAAQWDRLFSWFEEEGHHFAEAGEVLSDPSFAQTHDYIGPRGLGRWDRIAHQKELQRVEVEIRTLLDQQVEAWNRGDLTDFVSAYDEQVLFITPTGMTRGRDDVLRRYQLRYPSAAAMGRLELKIMNLSPVSGIDGSMMGDARQSGIHGATVVARWELDGVHTAKSEAGGSGDGETVSGHTLLVLHRSAGGWRIVQDASM